MLQDVLFALRVLRRSPGVTAAALAALALGVGANTAIFSLTEAVVLRPLPYPNPDRLMSLFTTDKRGGMNTSWPMFRDWQEQTRLFERMAAYAGDALNVTGGGEPTRAPAARVSADMFAMLSASPAAGGLDLSGQSVVLSHGFWQRRFGGDHGVVGRSLVVDGKAYAIAGALTPDFRFPKWARLDEPDVYLPLAPNPDRRFHFLRVIGRLKPGVTLAQARSEMDAIAAGIERALPKENRGEGAQVSTLGATLTAGASDTLRVFGLAALFVFLIACVNVSHLLLSQTSAREREMAIRSSLGASRGRLVRQGLIESLILGLAGGSLGVVLAMWGMPLLTRLTPAHTVFTARLEMGGAGVDWTVLGFAVAASILAAGLFGILPAWRASAGDRSARLLASRAPRRAVARGLLIAGETALSLVLLAGAGLLVKSLHRLLSVDPGFRTANLLAVECELPSVRYPEEKQRAEFVRAALDRIEALPGVSRVGAVNALPLSKETARASFTLRGSSKELGVAGFRAVTPGYFAALGIPVLRGRAAARGETGVGVINQSMARRYWANEDPIGKILETPHSAANLAPEPFQVVGVVGDVRHLTLDYEPQPEMYVLYSQFATPGVTIAIRSTERLETLASAVRREIRAVDPDLPLASVRTMDQLIAQDVAGRRFVLILVAVFAVVAVSLSAAGILAVVSHSVSQRAREIGIRMALGADARAVVGEALGQTLVWVGLGLAGGAVGAGIAGQLLRAWLYGVEPRDPAALAAAMTGVAAIAAAAAFVPARRAARVDPAITLRAE